MADKQMTKRANKRYVVGIDVGLNSTGLAAIEVDENNFPLRLLNCQTNIHDGGVDPNKSKNSESRLAVSGVARRTRRMRNRRRKRLQKLDDLLIKAGYPLIDTNDLGSAFEPWIARAELADGFIEDEAERKQKISIALRHLARHRGWRNPYHKWESLLDSPSYSAHYEKLLENIRELTGKYDLSDSLTPAQLVCEAIASVNNPDALRLRTAPNKGKEGVLPVRLFQQDNARELLQIFATQRVDKDEWRPLFAAVFEAKSPKGSAEKRVGKDPLDPRERRALKASLAFQKYRIMNMLTNLRIDREDGSPVLTVEERQLVFEVLCDSWGNEEHTWVDVADLLGLERSQLRGVGAKTDDGEERITSQPPTLTSFVRVYEFANNSTGSKKKLGKSLLAWFGQVDEADQEAMIKLLSNTVDIDAVRDEEQFARALEWIDELDDDQLGELDKVVLPAGRAAYSEKTLRRLTERMLETEDDLHEARKAVFGVDDSWRPPMDPIGEPIGNPSVDRVLKIVNRFLLNCQARWGAPVTVQIEHVRNGFSSVKSQREYAREYERNLGKRTEFRKGLQEKLVAEGYGFTRDESALRKIEAIQRQNGQCLYCGRELSFHTAEMDHIVPRAGAGSTNTRTNLMAVCGECNRSKTNLPFAVWCGTEQAKVRGVSLSEAVQRVNNFLFEGDVYNPKMQKNFRQQVILRLKRTDADPEIDNRSIESTAWMADELHRRIDWHFNQDKYSVGVSGADDGSRSFGEDSGNASGTKVWVFKGAVTASARRAAGIEKQIHFIGGSKKTRFDRRHHAVDAAVIALMSHGVARTLEVREQLRKSQKCVGGVQPGEVCWKDYPTEAMPDTYRTFHEWKQRMNGLLDLLNDALDNDRIPVLQNVRAKLGNAVAHDATIKPLDLRKLGSEIDAETIRRSSTPALYCALTRLPDYDSQIGLPADSDRMIVVNGEHLSANDDVAFFAGTSAQIMVQHGSADIGSAIHHARIYRYWQTLKSGKRKELYGMIRVFQTDLLHCRNQDLFTVPLPAQSISMRYAEPKIAKAILDGDAEYLGHLSVGDEIVIRSERAPRNIGLGIFDDFIREELQEIEAAACHWQVDGFPSESKLRLRPLYLSQEGLTELEKSGISIPKAVIDICSNGDRPAANTFAKYLPTVIRRNAFGEVRWRSRSGLPTSWRWVEDSM